LSSCGAPNWPHSRVALLLRLLLLRLLLLLLLLQQWAWLLIHL
jgi:hypothetical protein